MSREPRIALELGAIVAVWVVAMLGCQPGETRLSSREEPDSIAVEASSDPAPVDAAPSPSASLSSEDPSERPGDLRSHDGDEPTETDEEETSVRRTASASVGENSSATLQSTAQEALADQIDPTRVFDRWVDPKFVYFLTGQQYGYIEPCGCTGLANQKGGLARRHRLAQQLRDRGWSVVPLDAGNQVRRVGRQAEIKFMMTLEGMNTIGYQAVSLGKDDMRLSTGELVAATASFEGEPTPYVSANVAVLDRALMPRFRVIETNGTKIGVTSVVGDEWLEGVSSDEIVRESAAESLATVVEELKAAECDHYVLLAHATIDESVELARQFPLFEMVVTAGGLGDPTYQPETVGEHEAMLVQVGVKGMYVGVVGVFESEPRLRYQRVPLDGSYEDSQEMLQLLASYQTQLKDLGLGGLGVNPLPHPSGNQFVGSQACADCHDEAFEIWENSPHAHATESLVHPGERSEIPRHFDPECLSCHVTGWNPQRFIPYSSGYLGLKESPLMHASGCENCHGPGSQHVAVESGEIELGAAALKESREAMRLPYASAATHCMTCHDLDNSPDFHEDGAFQKYWDQIAH